MGGPADAARGEAAPEPLELGRVVRAASGVEVEWASASPPSSTSASASAAAVLCRRALRGLGEELGAAAGSAGSGGDDHALQADALWLLGHSSPRAAAALSSSSSAAGPLLVEEGSVDKVLDLLELGSPAEQVLAAQVVGRVAEVSAAGAAAVCDAGGVGALLDLLPQRNRAKFGAGATHAVWKEDPALTEVTLRCLRQLGAAVGAAREEIGAVATLNHVVDCTSSVSTAAREAAVCLLSMCPPRHLTHRAVLVQAALPCAEDALHNRGDLALRRSAAALLSFVTGEGQRGNAEALYRMGGLRTLAQAAAEDEDSVVRTYAAQAVTHFARHGLAADFLFSKDSVALLAGSLALKNELLRSRWVAPVEKRVGARRRATLPTRGTDERRRGVQRAAHAGVRGGTRRGAPLPPGLPPPAPRHPGERSPARASGRRRGPGV